MIKIIVPDLTFYFQYLLPEMKEARQDGQLAIAEVILKYYT